MEVGYWYHALCHGYFTGHTGRYEVFMYFLHYSNTALITHLPCLFSSGC